MPILLLRARVLITFGMFIICIIGGCSDDPPEEVTEDDVGPHRVTRVVVDPAPAGDDIPTNTEFTLTFNEGVVGVTVNDTPASGAELNWKWSAWPGLPYGSISLTIEWINLDGSAGFIVAGPYFVTSIHDPLPEITHATVADGAIDVDPAPINATGLRYDFNKLVTGTIKLTDEVGGDRDWWGIVAGQTATLTPAARQELVNETTYKIEINVRDGGGNGLTTTITFVTKPK